MLRFHTENSEDPWRHSNPVMARLDPAISGGTNLRTIQLVTKPSHGDGRVKPGHDGVGSASGSVVTA